MWASVGVGLAQCSGSGEAVGVGAGLDSCRSDRPLRALIPCGRGQLREFWARYGSGTHRYLQPHDADRRATSRAKRGGIGGVDLASLAVVSALPAVLWPGAGRTADLPIFSSKST